MREKCALKRKRPCINENGRPTTSTSRHAMHLAWCLNQHRRRGRGRSRSSGKRSGSLWRCDRQCAARDTRRVHSPPRSSSKWSGSDKIAHRRNDFFGLLESERHVPPHVLVAVNHQCGLNAFAQPLHATFAIGAAQRFSSTTVMEICAPREFATAPG